MCFINSGEDSFRAMGCRAAVFLQLLLLIAARADDDVSSVKNEDEVDQDRLVTALIESLNAQQNSYKYSQGVLLSTQKINNLYDITASAFASCKDDSCAATTVKCKASILHGNRQLEVQDSAKCEFLKDEKDDAQDATASEVNSTSSDPVELAHEIQLNDQHEGSGEQFVAVRRESNGDNSWCAGCPTEVNISAEGVTELANQAIQHLDRHKPNEKHSLQKIISVHRQARIVNGVHYILLLEVETTSCSKEASSDPDKPCQDKSTSICEVKILEKPWLKLHDGSKFRAVLSNNCTEQYTFGDEGEALITTGDDVIKVVHTDQLQAVQVEQSISPEKLKDIQEQIVSNTIVKPESEIIKETEEKLIVANVGSSQQTVKKNAHDLPLIEAVTSKSTVENKLSVEKVEALNKFLDFINFDQPLIHNIEPVPVNKDLNKSDNSKSDSSEEGNNTTKVEISKKDSSAENNTSEETKEPEVVKVRKKRNIKSSKEDVFINKLSQFAVETLDEFDADSLKRVVQNVIDVNEKHYPHSTVYHLKLNVGFTNCAEDESDIKKCTTNKFIKKNKECTVEVEVDLNDHKKVLNSSCRDKKQIKRRGLPGGIAPIELPDDEVNRLVKLSLDHYESLTSSAGQHSFEKLISVTQQVVEGFIYRLKFEVKRGNVKKICNASVYEKAWLNFREVKANCKEVANNVDKNSISKSRIKRQGIPGGITPAELPDDEVNRLVKLSLDHYESLTSSAGQHSFENLISISKQVVAGIIYRLKFEVKTGNVKKICNASVYEKAWLNFREVKANCQEVANNVVKNSISKYRTKRHSYTHLMKQLHDKALLEELQFNAFIMSYEKGYKQKSNEYKKRFENFKRNLDVIKHLNENEQGTAKYGVTQFADLSKEEFKSYMGLRRDLYQENYIPFPKADIPDIEIPSAFDWRDQGAVTPVKDQGQCGSCWAFSVTGNIEGINKIKNGNLLSLSEQELVDCDKLDSGCDGGLPDNAYRAIEQLGGLELENDYPYDAEDEKCSFNPAKVKVEISGAVNISKNETEMAQWLTQNGPISIGINANAMQFYMGGISHPLKFLCSPNNLDHGVLIVGYGIHEYPLFRKKLPFWIVKNSWGPSWGENGYYRVYRGDGTCGLNLMASSAVI